MRAVMLVAGVGSRLRAGRGPAEAEHPPKVLLEFSGRTLLERHIGHLRDLGVEGLTLAVGYRSADIEAEIARLGAGDFVATVTNPDYRNASVTSLAAAADALDAGGDVLLMDGDVLYDRRVLARLVETDRPNCMLMDRALEPGDEPVKICVRDGAIVDFRKRVEGAHDLRGESVGFFRFDGNIAARIAAGARDYVAAGRVEEPYEEVIRDVVLAAPGDFGWEDITGLPWIEIDFAVDVDRAEAEILPRIEEGS